MFRVLSGLNWENKILHEKLREQITEGFTQIDACFFLKAHVFSNMKRSDFPDEVMYECFSNSWHIEDFVEQDCVVQGILFLDTVFKAWNDTMHPGILKGSVSETEFEGELGAVVKFHLVRPDVADFIDDNTIEKFEEPLLIFTSR